MKQGEMKDLNAIIKGDVQGPVEALAASLMKIDVEGVNVRIIHTAVGAINESDVTLQCLKWYYHWFQCSSRQWCKTCCRS